jgi:hypothetical protein
MKDKKFTILCIILIILLAGFAIYMVLQQPEPDKTPVGTYCAEGATPAENTYFSLFKDQRFEIWGSDYRIQGTYAEEPDGKNLRLQLTCSDGTTATAMFDRHDQIFLDGSTLPRMPQKILAFQRINDVPGRVGHQ